MTGWNMGEVWLIILALGLATYVIRFSFLGLIGDRQLPDWLLRHLRYTPVAILPALVIPSVLWPSAADHTLSLPHILSALVTVGVGYRQRGAVVATVAGVATYLALIAVF